MLANTLEIPAKPCEDLDQDANPYAFVYIGPVSKWSGLPTQTSFEVQLDHICPLWLGQVTVNVIALPSLGFECRATSVQYNPLGLKGPSPKQKGVQIQTLQPNGWTVEASTNPGTCNIRLSIDALNGLAMVVAAAVPTSSDKICTFGQRRRGSYDLKPWRPLRLVYSRIESCAPSILDNMPRARGGQAKCCPAGPPAAPPPPTWSPHTIEYPTSTQRRNATSPQSRLHVATQQGHYHDSVNSSLDFHQSWC